jgi:Raf kinase inhibitor-like YbhB/YbcL family protein
MMTAGETVSLASGRRGYARDVLRRGSRCAVLAALSIAAGCGGGGTVKGPAPAAPDRLRLTSPAFEDGAAIPKRHSCDGAQTSPPLRWTKPPAGTRSLALTVEDPDAPGGTFVHWTVYGIDPAARGFREGAVPQAAHEGENSAGKRGYAGPCPPHGDKQHHYVFTLYALNAEPKLKQGASPGEVRAAVAKAAIARGRLTGVFKRG